MIVDQRHIVLEVDGFDSVGMLYPVGFLFIEDRGGKLVRDFVRYFENFERRARELTVKDFGQS